MRKATQMTGPIHGYKVFDSDWSCEPYGNRKQYTCPGRFKEEGELEVCGHGMHFCQRLSDCFNYYNFNSENKVAEVIAHGKIMTEHDTCCTNDLEIIRELSWDEVLKLVNIGKNCTGYNNIGNLNVGSSNVGSMNIGAANNGNQNTGTANIGNWNSGSGNIGTANSGDDNVGVRNTGIGNTGDKNSGNMNTGDSNTGDWNKSSHNTGCFNTEEPTIMLFNKPSAWTYTDWTNSRAGRLMSSIPKESVEFVCKDDMTDEEKTANPSYEITGGYLKVFDKSERYQAWWDELANSNKSIIKSIPNFDPEIFYECTGIKVD